MRGMRDPPSDPGRRDRWRCAVIDRERVHSSLGRRGRHIVSSIAAARHREPRSRWRILAILTLVALVLRLYQLEAHSLSLDEVITAESVRYQTLGDVLGWAGIWSDKSPLLFVLTWLLRPLGGGEVAVRLPLVIA